MLERSDAGWIRCLKANEAVAVQDLWEQLYTWGLNMARVKSVAPDLGAEAAIAAFHNILKRGIFQYNFGCPFLIYCRIILTNELRRQLRRQPPIADPLDESNEPVAPDTLLQVVPEKVHEILQPCWDNLTKQEGVVLSRRYFGDELPQEIADQLSINRKYVNVIAQRGRKKLRDCLELRGYRGIDDIL